MTEIEAKYHTFFEKVREDHRTAEEESSGAGGHDFIHTVTVARYAVLIAPDERSGELGWIAGMCHNTDRIHPYLSSREVENKICEYLVFCGDLNETERKEIAEAAMNHDKKNDPKGSLIKMILQDADRIANIGLMHVIRCGQHRPTLPAYDPNFILKKNPAGSHLKPITAFDDVYSSLEWDPEGPEVNLDFCLRIPKAVEIGRPFFRNIREGCYLLESQARYLNLKSS